MQPRMLISLAIATVSLVFASSCSQIGTKKKSPKAQGGQATVSEVAGPHYTTIVFNKGQSTLSSINKENLRTLATRADKANRPVSEIKILAWADTEYPDKISGMASTADIILASERARIIREYLEEDLKAREVDSYNMAKRPGLVSKIFKNDEYKLKEAFEKSGTTGSKLPDGSVSYTKASKALVIIDYSDDAVN
jgi:hypothetical protein